MHWTFWESKDALKSDKLLSRIHHISRPQSINGNYIYSWCLNGSGMIFTWGAGYSHFLLSDFFLLPFHRDCISSASGEGRRGGGALLSDYVHRRLADREREVRVTTLCIPVHPSVVLGVAVFLHDPSAMFPCPVTLGWEIVMYFHCCWFLGTWSPFFGGSFNPAHASTLSFLVQFCLVHFFQYAICLLPGFWLTHIA